MSAWTRFCRWLAEKRTRRCACGAKAMYLGFRCGNCFHKEVNE